MRLRGTAGLAVAATLAGCVALAAQGKDTMWSTVSAQGPSVSLSWNKDHPWDKVLGSGGAQLIARYRGDGRGDTTEVMSVATGGDRTDRTFRFTLPNDLRSRPLGPICLLIQLPGRKVLPVRRASKEDADTAGFRYEAWERQVRQRSDQLAAERRVAQAEQALTIAAQNVARQETVVSGRGWSDRESCNNAAAPTAADTALQPYDVVAPSDQDDIARRVCVYRVWNGRVATERYVANRLETQVAKLAAARDQQQALELLMGVFGDAFVLPDVAGPLLEELIQTGEAGDLAARMAQAAEFRRDWERLSPSMAGYQPHLGKANDMLGMPSTGGQVAFRVFGIPLARRIKAEWAVEGLPAASATDKAGVVGIALDAYFGCLDDGRKQLKIKWDNWQALKASAPRRAAATQDFFVRECQQEVDRLQKVKAERATMEGQLAREQQALRELRAKDATLPTKPQLLNQTSCDVP
jgi:hypothetical protein